MEKDGRLEVSALGFNDQQYYLMAQYYTYNFKEYLSF